MITTDRNEPLLHEEKENGQNKAYLVLSEEERDKGFIRPYRDSYVHVGRFLSYNKSIHRMLDEQERRESVRVNGRPYVAVMTQLTKEDGSFMGGPYVTQEELDAWDKKERVGGCSALTKMNQAISETYARNPKFYNATFCVGCGKHLPVNEFVWDGTNEEVGS